MKVEILVNLKPLGEKIFSAGTIFDAPIEELPPWLVAEIEAKSKHIKVHSAPKKAAEPKAPTPEPVPKPKVKAKAKVVAPKQKEPVAPKKVKPTAKKRGRPRRT